MLHLNLSPTSWVPELLSGGRFLTCKMQLLVLHVDFERTGLLIHGKVSWLVPGME